VHRARLATGTAGRDLPAAVNPGPRPAVYRVTVRKRCAARTRGERNAPSQQGEDDCRAARADPGHGGGLGQHPSPRERGLPHQPAWQGGAESNRGRRLATGRERQHRSRSRRRADRLARHAERTGRPLPGHDGVSGWLVGDRSALLRRGAMVVKIVLTGDLGMDRAAALAWLTERVTERLAAAPGDEALSEDEWAPAPDG
jgi:hypothetical protein